MSEDKILEHKRAQLYHTIPLLDELIFDYDERYHRFKFAMLDVRNKLKELSMDEKVTFEQYEKTNNELMEKLKEIKI